MLSEAIKDSLRRTITEVVNELGPPPDGGNPAKIISELIDASQMVGDEDGYKQLTEDRKEAEQFVAGILGLM